MSFWTLYLYASLQPRKLVNYETLLIVRHYFWKVQKGVSPEVVRLKLHGQPNKLNQNSLFETRAAVPLLLAVILVVRSGAPRKHKV